MSYCSLWPANTEPCYIFFRATGLKHASTYSSRNPSSINRIETEMFVLPLLGKFLAKIIFTFSHKFIAKICENLKRTKINKCWLFLKFMTKKAKLVRANICLGKNMCRSSFKNKCWTKTVHLCFFYLYEFICTKVHGEKISNFILN